MTQPSRVLVTGATGFVGRVVCARLERHGISVVRHARRAAGEAPGDVAADVVGDIAGAVDWRPRLDGVDAVVHLAAVTHSGGLRTRRARAQYFAVNVDATCALAEQARECGVGRFVYLSSIKASGERSARDGATFRALSAADPPAPEDNYGHSKLAAEKALAGICADAPMDVIALRPPLVYGPRVRGNFARLLDLVARGVPLPFAAVDNRRSLIYVDNLAGAIECALRAAPMPGLRSYALADVTLSTPTLVSGLAEALGVPARLVRVPPALLEAVARLPGPGAALARLTGNLVVDADAARRELDWQPEVDVADGFAATAQWYRQPQR